MRNKLLAILIPTYNRVDSLITNLKILEEHFSKLDCYIDIKVIISDNNSTDETFETLKKYTSSKITEYELFKQDTNIGLEKNAVFCLNQSDAKFSMFLGDDDYLDFYYLDRVLEYLRDDEVTCIIPNFYNINADFERTSRVRDKISDDKIYTKRDNKLELMFKAHQMSGVTVRTKSTLESYIKLGGSNIYLFMYFAAFNIERGKTVHITNFPVKVTSTNSKDWGYGDDGLITDVIENIGMIARSKKEKFKLEKYYLLNNRRYTWFLKKPLPFLRIIFSSKRYSNKLRAYILFIMISEACLMPFKKIAKIILKTYGFEVYNRKIFKASDTNNK